MKFVSYVLYSKSKNLHYFGHTNDLSRRLAEHNDAKRSSWASCRGPWELLAVKDFNSRSGAMGEEKFLKTLKNRDTLLTYINTAGWRRGTSRGS